MSRLTIYDRRERALVAVADALLAPAALRRVFRRAPAALPRRILCLRLERIGDLLMTLPALAELRALAPDGVIELVVGSWNAEIAAAIPTVDRVAIVTAEWLARPADPAGLSPLALAGHALTWRAHRYDLVLNFEPDIRTNMAVALAGAQRTAGFVSGGGGSLLDIALDFDPRAHTADNALALVRAVFGATAEDPPASRLRIPAAEQTRAAALLQHLGPGPKAGIHVSGGRAVKQWPETRFRDVAEWLIRDRGAGVVLTGTPEDRAQVEIVRAALPPDRVADLSTGVGLLTVAAAIEQLDVFVTGDTGPMHLAHAVGTPVVAVFGPSDPRRYGPRGAHDVIVRIDLPCSPCNRIRLPPARCTGHVPDCLAGIATPPVLAAIDEVLQGTATPLRPRRLP